MLSTLPCCIARYTCHRIIECKTLISRSYCANGKSKLLQADKILQLTEAAFSVAVAARLTELIESDISVVLAVDWGEMWDIDDENL